MVFGRLLCCLNYEDQTYSELKKDFPRVGQLYHENGIDGKVVSLNVFKRKITVETKNKTLVEVDV